MFDGDRIPLTDLHVAIMLSFPASILDFTSQVLRLSTLFYKTGSLRTIGYFLFHSLSKAILKTAELPSLV